MGKAIFNTGSRFVNRLDRCGCGAKKLALDKRCVKCQIRCKETADESVTDGTTHGSSPTDRWEAVETFMEAGK